MGPSSQEIRGMFDKGARSYDCTNTYLSMGIDYLWRREVARLLPKDGAGLIADVACGTAKVAVAIARRNPLLRVIGVDFSQHMIYQGVKRVKKHGLGDQISLVIGDGCALPLKRTAVDAVTIVFGIRNIVFRERALEEFYDVLKTGGRLIVVEFGFPKNRVLRRLYTLYFDYLLPPLGNRLMGVDQAYDYLRKSVYDFPPPDMFMTMLGKAGFADVTVRPLTGGIVTMFSGKKV